MPDDDLPEILFRRRRRHARAQARSAAKRKAADAPRRDDLARAGYYVLLLTVHEAEAQGEIERAMRIRRRMRLILEDASFDPQVGAQAFDRHVESVVADVTAWAAGRKEAARQRGRQSAADAE